jgi:predicted RND superfamily exporter protein
MRSVRRTSMLLLRPIIGRLVDAAGRRPATVLLLALGVLAATWLYARKLELRPDFLELLPRDSPGFRAFEHQLGRVGGGASFLVVVDSPEARANQRFSEDLAGALTSEAATRAACAAKCTDDRCRASCGPDFVSYVETGTRELHAFFEARKWLYADLKDLQEADATLDRQIALRSGLVADLEDDDGPAASARPGGSGGKAEERRPTLGMDPHYERWKKGATKYDDFPSGYFQNDAGTLLVVRIVSNASGTGGTSGDTFFASMRKRIDDMHVTERYHPQMRIGYAGDIPNAVAEKESTVSEAVWAAVFAMVLILAGVVVFFRSVWSLVVIGLPALLGVGAAYAFATAAFGYVNLPGAFLGPIILGNGINYPIVLLARYNEFRARGMEGEAARREAVLNAFRAELVGAAVAAIAYGSLGVTHFPGFAQFGAIGFVGMLLVWVSIVPLVPALIVLIERLQEKLPRWLRGSPRIAADGSSGPLIRLASRLTNRWAWPLVAVTLMIFAFAASRCPRYFADPWEYDFDKLGSRSSKTGGAGEWSNRADNEVFRGKQNISGTLILADTPEQVPAVKERILTSDRADPQGALIDSIITVQDYLPGTAAEQKEKLAVLDSIRDRLTPRVLADVTDAERARLLEMRPPENLQEVVARDLPPLIRRHFEERDGKVGTVMYVRYKYGVSFSDGHNLLRMAKTTDNVRLPDGTVVQTASRSTIFAELIRSMERDGPLATASSFLAVMIVVLFATHSRRGALSVLLALVVAVTCLVGGAALTDTKLNFFNFIALPITFGIGCEYPFNVYDRTRILGGDITSALARTGGAVALCSFTTTVGYSSMLLSDNQALQSFGRLAMSGEIACATMALLFVPALLHVLSKK